MILPEKNQIDNGYKVRIVLDKDKIEKEGIYDFDTRQEGIDI